MPFTLSSLFQHGEIGETAPNNVDNTETASSHCFLTLLVSLNL